MPAELQDCADQSIQHAHEVVVSHINLLIAFATFLTVPDNGTRWQIPELENHGERALALHKLWPDFLKSHNSHVRTTAAERILECCSPLSHDDFKFIRELAPHIENRPASFHDFVLHQLPGLLFLNVESHDRISWFVVRLKQMCLPDLLRKEFCSQSPNEQPRLFNLDQVPKTKNKKGLPPKRPSWKPHNSDHPERMLQEYFDDCESNGSQLVLKDWISNFIAIHKRQTTWRQLKSDKTEYDRFVAHRNAGRAWQTDLKQRLSSISGTENE